MNDAHELRVGLAAELSRHKWLTTPEWQEAFGTVPRHLFLHRFFALTADRSRYEAINHSHPDWLTLAYRNAVWPTQLDGDDTRWDEAWAHGPITGTPTCSSTQPSLMAVMLEALDVREEDRVLEIGTGTGYNAALLAHRLGDDHVVTVDIDANLSEQALRDLADAGYTPTVAAADGTKGYPNGAPFDRVIATCSVTAIPPAWLTQVQPGGIILTNLYRQLIGGSLVRLTIREDRSATGQLLDDWGGFMPVRTHLYTDPAQLIRAASQQDGDKHASHLPALVSEDGQAWVVLADLLMAEVSRTDIARADGDVQWLVHPDGSWAYHDTTGIIEQGGPRRLWNELEQIHELWTDNGKPTRDQIGLTVTPSGDHHIWLHNDANVITRQHGISC
ncbi:MAG: ATP-grasp peptide maturase system methyltransferase [Pseudonocardiaceae bacterium]